MVSRSIRGSGRGSSRSYVSKSIGGRVVVKNPHYVDSFIKNKYLNTKKAKDRYIQLRRDPANKDKADLYLAQQVASNIKKENNTKKGVYVSSTYNLKEQNTKAGYHWFKPDTLRYFGSKVYPDFYKKSSTSSKGYFITSEDKGFNDKSKGYSVRVGNEKTGQVDTIGEFNQYSSKTEAKNKIMSLIKKEN